ncbi:MAG: hypothetical protein ABIT38_22380 [Gemmatimonadaceae bacterium]
MLLLRETITSRLSLLQVITHDKGRNSVIDGDVVYTDSRGRFFVRRPQSRQVTLRVMLDDFLLPGLLDVVSAPKTTSPSRDETGRRVVIVLRRRGSQS